MTNFCQQLYVPNSVITQISGCIMATQQPVKPSSLLEEILCDSDTYHFGTKRFQQTNLLVKQEMEALTGHRFEHWIENSIRLLKEHVFFTSYCQEKLNAGKAANLEWLQRQL